MYVTMDSPDEGLLVIAAILAAVFITVAIVVFVAFFVLRTYFYWHYYFKEREAIDSDIESKGGKLISKMNYFGLIPFISRFSVRYVDSDGQEHLATCNVYDSSRVAWVKDEIVPEKNSN